MKSKLILLLACFVLVSVDLPAQSIGSKFKDKVLNKMKKKGEQKTDQAIDSAIDKPVDKTEQKVKESVKDGGNKEEPATEKNTGNAPGTSGAQQPPSEADIQQMMESMGGGAVKLEDYPDLDQIKPSPFKGSFDMDFETWKKGKKVDDGTMSWFIREYDVAMIPDIEINDQKQDSRIVIQRKKGIMLMLTNDNGKKTGMVMKMKTISVDLSKTEIGEELENVKVEVYKNERKTINNYNCYKVKTWDDTFESIGWVTEDLNINMQQLFGFMSVQTRGENPYEEKFGHIKGMVIESTSTDKKTGEIDIMRMNNIKTGNPDSGMFSSDGYDLMQMPDFGGFGGQ